MNHKIGTVYLIHFDALYRHCRHYIGFTELTIEQRLERHKGSRGARLLRAVMQAGINFNIVRTWENKTIEFERKLKNQKNSKKFCPICNPEKYLNY